MPWVMQDYFPNLYGRRSCKPPVCGKWGFGRADVQQSGCSTEGRTQSIMNTSHPSDWEHQSWVHFWVHTWMVPLRKDSRFLQTGSRINMQLKLRQAAGALAHDKACCRAKKRSKCEECFTSAEVKPDVLLSLNQWSQLWPQLEPAALHSSYRGLIWSEWG